MAGQIQIELGENDDGRRVDRILRKALPNASLGEIYRALRKGAVRRNGARVRGEERAAAGDLLTLPGWLAGESDPGASQVDAERLEAPNSDARGLDGRVLFRDSDLIILNKRAGELTHGPDSLATAVIASLAPNLASGVSFTPGPLHRLDRNTSGAIAFSASLSGAQTYGAAIAEGRTRKIYIGIFAGIIGPTLENRPVVWSIPLERDTRQRITRPSAGGKHARTDVTPIASGQSWTLALAEITTGRPHQIRAHAAAAGHALLGDAKYGGIRWPGGRYVLHSALLSFQRIGPTVTAALERAQTQRIERLCGPDAAALAEARIAQIAERIRRSQ